jgi:hypothetical protein
VEVEAAVWCRVVETEWGCHRKEEAGMPEWKR